MSISKEMGRKKKRNGKLIITLAFLAILAIIVGIILIIKITPTSEKMSGYEYFNIEQSSQGDNYFILLNNEKQEENALMKDGHLYLSKEFVTANLNSRFYFDKEANAVIKTDANTTYTFVNDNPSYTDALGKAYNADCPVVRSIDGRLFISVEFAAKDGGFTFEAYTEPQRLVIKTDTSAHKVVTADGDIKLRYRGGIKSPIVAEVDSGTRLYYNKDVDEWTEVRTDSGIVGYVKTSSLSEVKEEADAIPEITSYAQPNYQGKVSMAWFQVGGTAGNSTLSEVTASNECFNILAPTWFAVLDNSGNMSNFASSATVNDMHSQGKKVWALVNDFSTDIDRDTFLESKAVRTKIIDALVNSCRGMGIDGINIDFEYINAKSAANYLQFLRELSVVCHGNGLALSTDNYRPYNFNSFYDVGEQSRFVDYVFLMGYDEHYSGSEAGSVASIGFVRGGVEAMLNSGVKANQLVLGMPFYTRIWSIDGSKTTSRAVGMEAAFDALREGKGLAQWDDTFGQYFASFTSGSTTTKIWFEEEKSIAEKLKVMQSYGLAGCAQWKLGLERDEVWDTIAEFLK